MIDSIDAVEKLIANIIESKAGGTGNRFLRLNETDYYTANKNTLCHFPGCKNDAIGSHTFPHSFLRRITKNNKVYSTDIKHIVANVYESEGIEFVRDTHIKYSGVQPLFCKSHDDKVFKRVESRNFNVDIETYLSLFLYRAFIYDYELESEFHRPKQVRKLNTDKPYSKKNI